MLCYIHLCNTTYFQINASSSKISVTYVFNGGKEKVSLGPEEES